MKNEMSLKSRRLYKEANRLLDRALYILRENEKLFQEQGLMPKADVKKTA